MRHPEYNEARFAKVLQYLHRHYRDEIDLARLADIACFSPCHWHRIYRAVMGETIAETLKRIRLHHAAHQLLTTAKPLAEVARAYMNIGATFSHAESLLTLRGQLPVAQARYFGIYYDDPDACPAIALRAEVAIYTGDAPVAAPFTRRLLPGGRYAVLHHRGAYAELHRAYDWLYRDWLLQSPYRLADAPCIKECRNDWQTTPPQELLTDIWLPLASDGDNA